MIKTVLYLVCRLFLELFVEAHCSNNHTKSCLFQKRIKFRRKAVQNNTRMLQLTWLHNCITSNERAFVGLNYKGKFLVIVFLKWKE